VIVNIQFLPVLLLSSFERRK